ncbi:MAG: hypothetical protein PHI23_03735 [Candidatus Peribacteraceae bacterium]|nr:hypothetical protein [Candidatus Peribacteraceae bacterium]
MLHRKVSTSSAILAILATVIAAPLSTQAIMSANVGGGFYNEALRSLAEENKATVRANTRTITRLNELCQGRVTASSATDPTCKAYWVVANECLKRRGLREDTGCPNVNDVTRIQLLKQKLLNGESIDGTGATVEESTVHSAASGLSASDLTPFERRTLHNATLTGSCSKKLPSTILLLCREIVGEENLKSAPIGFTNDIQAIQAKKASPQPSIKLRLQMMEEAVKPSAR